MKLYVMSGGGGGRGAAAAARGPDAPPAAADAPAPARGRRPGGPPQILEIDLERLLPDAVAGNAKPAAEYARVCGTIPPGINAGGNMGLDANDDKMYFSVTGPDTAQLSEGQTMQKAYGPRNMGAGPSGLRSMDLKTGEVKTICNVGFQ